MIIDGKEIAIVRKGDLISVKGCVWWFPTPEEMRAYLQDHIKEGTGRITDSGSFRFTGKPIRTAVVR